MPPPPRLIDCCLDRVYAITGEPGTPTPGGMGELDGDKTTPSSPTADDSAVA